MLNNMACTARFKLWFRERIFATRISERIVLRMNDRNVEEVVCGRRGNKVFKSLEER